MTDSVPALKRAFLASQVRLLSAPLKPGQGWQQAAAAASRDRGRDHDEGTGSDDDGEGEGGGGRGGISDAVVNQALLKVNNAVRSHNRAAFPAFALAHVAQQIDRLYWDSATPTGHRQSGATAAENEVDRAADLRDDGTIDLLPGTWQSSTTSQSAQGRSGGGGSSLPASPRTARKTQHPRKSALETFDSGTRYTRLAARLKESSARRQRARERLDEAEQLLAVLEPIFDPQSSIQPNLVTKDGALLHELNRIPHTALEIEAKVRSNPGGSRAWLAKTGKGPEGNEWWEKELRSENQQEMESRRKGKKKAARAKQRQGRQEKNALEGMNINGDEDDEDDDGSEHSISGILKPRLAVDSEEDEESDRAKTITILASRPVELDKR